MAETLLRPCPAPALEAAFGAVLREQMQDMPMVNPVLSVQAVGFRPWGGFWLGVLVTPWFMNLWLMPRDDAQWQSIGEREKRRYVFPAGVFEFIGGLHAALGDYQACSLFSPMFEFENAEAARDTALASLEALMDDGQPAAAAATPEPAADSSKRRFLFGSTSGAERRT
jgi:[NiFe] hydrogenase assembly HybE family chaperone